MKTETTGREKSDQAGRQGPDPRDAMVGEQVIHSLGKPANLLRVQTRRLWGDYYRVNVFVGESAGCATVASSYFVRADAQGRVLTTDPVIAKRH